MRNLAAVAVTAAVVGTVLLVVVAILVLVNADPRGLVTITGILGYVGLGLVALGAIAAVVAPARSAANPAGSSLSDSPRTSPSEG